VLIEKQERMGSAMAFIKSGGTLFPARAHAVANFPDCRIWTTDNLAGT